VESAGTKPSIVRPEAIAAMDELGIEISGHRSKCQGTETPGGAAANACPQLRDRHRRGAEGELGAKEAEETRRCLTSRMHFPADRSSFHPYYDLTQGPR
jgi:hypothetical protein